MFKRLDKVKKIVYNKETMVKIGQPAIYPKEIVAELKTEYVKFKNLKAAYLGWIFDPSSNLPPHLIIGLDLIGDKEEIISASSKRIIKYLKSNEFIDFIVVDRNEGIIGYLKNTSPFYVLEKDVGK